jgi:hypothetical protein
MPQQVLDLENVRGIVLIASFLIGGFLLFYILFRTLFKLGLTASICLSILIFFGMIIVMHFFGISIFSLYIGNDRSWFFFILFIICICVFLVTIKSIAWLSADKPPLTVNASERARILQMVEAGKISTDEGKELLNALGNSTALKGQEKFSRADAVMLIGVALVVLGFFLPWLYVSMPNLPGFPQYTNVVGNQDGYQMGAMGWTVFIIALVSAVPVFVTPKNFLYKILMLQMFLLIIGIALVISILVRVGSHLGAGLVVCLIGFLVAFVASGAKFKQLAA